MPGPKDDAIPDAEVNIMKDAQVKAKSGLEPRSKEKLKSNTEPRSDAKPQSDAKPRGGRTAKSMKSTPKKTSPKAQSRAGAPSSRKTSAKQGKPTDSEKPVDSQPAPEIIKQVFESLKKLEHSYASINSRLSNIKEGTTEATAEGAKAGSGKKGELDAFVAKQSDKLGGKLKMISGTLDVLKSVLRSQSIPLDHLAKRPSATKSSGTTSGDAARPKGQSRQAQSQSVPRGKARKDEMRVKVRKVLLGEERKPIPQDPVKTSWTSLENRLTGVDKAPLVLAAAAAGTSALGAARFAADTATDATAANETAKNDSEAPPTKPKRTKKSEKPLVNVKRVHAESLRLVPVEIPDTPEVPKLAYGLDRVLFNPGVYHMQDPRSRVFNFDPYLGDIMPISEFDFNALQKYVTSSKDNTLISLAAKLGRKYTGSTSSMTQTLSHFHFLLSAWRPINPDNMSRQFTPEYSSFTAISRAPAASFLHFNEGVYAIDADKEYDSASILSMLGKSMEKQLTLPREEFEKYRRANSDQITEEERNAAEAFHYTTMGDFLMRSQLDAYDPRLPGSGMFDLKTRAVVSIRMDAQQFHKGLGYEIRRRYGQWESFEREYFDMIRSAFLKYSLQVRMGRMDGIFVAFHNTQRIFGFQYIPINEMDQAIHGTFYRNLGDQEFKLSLHLLNKVLDRATERFPGRSIRLHVETRPTDPPFMYVFAKPVTKEDIDKVQTRNQAAVREFEEQILGMASEESSEPEMQDSEVERSVGQEEDEEAVSVDVSSPESSSQVWQTQAFWEEMQEKVNEAVEDDALGIGHVREAIHDALEQSALLKARTPEEARWYVDGLLEALTRNQASEAQDIDGKDDQTDAMSASDIDTPSADVTQALESSTAQEAVPAASEGTESVQETDKGSSLQRSSRNLGLKELILRVASNVDENLDVEETTDIPEDDATSDVSKLRTFERILSKLVAESKQSEIKTNPQASEMEEATTEMFEDLNPSISQTAASTESPKDSEGKETQVDETPELDIVDNELLGMVLTVRNRVNGEYAPRPDPKAGVSGWTVEYSIEELPAGRAEHLYKALQVRRKKALSNDKDAKGPDPWYQMFSGKLEQMSKRGRKFRAKMEEAAKENPVHVFGMDDPVTYDEAFGHRAQWKTVSWDETTDELREDDLDEETLKEDIFQENKLNEAELKESQPKEDEPKNNEPQESEPKKEELQEDKPRDS
ncbi:hypothetical protein CCUS01_04107 [Colletotrichum cuscutae]|uniref:Mitochondrial membrane protein n=1 Tax=Colletotrichum cuscutae TaxID=1209917 RepID=A0AAI9Y7B4_9PEZI|nr:hypothetical protein CCUS01_04107 [Colletotrichum cuscutae]